MGHRGAPRRARENTIDSLDWAENLGVDAVEFDLRQTRDGEAILFHDEEIVARDQRIPVRSFTSREIEQLTLPSEFGDYRIPRLEEVFHRYGRVMRYVVEVKVGTRHAARASMARRVSQLAADYGVTAAVSSLPSTPSSFRRVREVDAEIATSFLFDHPWRCPSRAQPHAALSRLSTRSARRDLVTAALIEQAARAGLSVHPWTADEPEIQRLLGLGVASLTTNAPELAIRIRDGAPAEERGIAVSRPS